MVGLDVPPAGSTVIPIRSPGTTADASRAPGPAIRPSERAPDGLITHTWYTRPDGGDIIPAAVTTASRRVAEATTVTLPPAEVLVVSMRASGAVTTRLIAASLARVDSSWC